MKKFNVILLLNPECTHILMCLRRRQPYLGKYNLVGGKLEAGKEPLTAAYRELREETAVTPDDVTLRPLITLLYHRQDIELQAYTGRLRHDVTLVEEAHPLVWMSIEENFFDMERFAGEGNIGHMLAQLRMDWNALNAP